MTEPGNEEDLILPKVENPDIYPTYIFADPGDTFNAGEKRGRGYFKTLEEMGMRVIWIPPNGEIDHTMFTSPLWTFLYMSVPIAPWRSFVEQITATKASVIFDCHFPIMDMETAQGDEEDLEAVRQNRDVMLDNLAAACAVITPRPEWSADLSEINSNVWVIPDVDSDQDALTFTLRFSEMCRATFARCTSSVVEIEIPDEAPDA